MDCAGNMPKRSITSDFVRSEPPSEEDARLDAPAFHRNGEALVDALAPQLSEATGSVLEIGSGTGQHAALFARAFPHLRFQPSDPDPTRRASIDAWRAQMALKNVAQAIDLDVSSGDWARKLVGERDYCALFCANVIHIANWPVAEGLFRGAAQILSTDGFLGLYGPFRWHGRHISAGNAAFDVSLRSQNTSWGVRDVDDIDVSAASHGLKRIETVEMPANNHLLFFGCESNSSN